MSEFNLKAETREGSTKKSLNAIRDARKIPAVIYGGKGDSVSVVVAERELLGAIKEGGHNAIIHLEHGKKNDTVIVKALQRHPVTNIPVHVDFQRIDLKKKITVKVQIHVVGEAPGVKLHGGVLEHVLRELEVQALPNQIPQKIEVDISGMEVGAGIVVKDVKAPAGCEILNDPEQIVVHVVHATKEDAPAVAADAGVAAAEPEVIAKGKKDEEGAEGAADAKGAAKPDAKAAAKPDAKAAAPKKDDKK